MVSFTTQALRYAAKPLHPVDRTLMIERGIGYWISPDHQFVPTPPRVSHADVIRELIDIKTLDEDAAEAMLIDANSYALSQGWTRVRIYPGQHVAYVDFGQSRQVSHRKLVQDLIDHLGLADVAVKFTDEEGNYVSP